MRPILIDAAPLAIFLAFLLAGFGILIWLSPVPAEQLTPVQKQLIELADTAAKVSFGAILGLIGYTLARR